LSRKLPAPREIKQIMDGLRNKDDLHTAIIAVSIVEAALEKLIVTRTKKREKEFLDRLFQNKGPLSDFNSKILVAEAFGFLTGPLAAELHVMRAIRNAFAHAKIHISFADPPVSAEVRRFRLGLGTSARMIDEGLRLPVNISEKDVFLLATKIALIILDEIAKKKSSADKVITRALRKT